MQQSWGQKRGLFLTFVADLRRQKTRKTRIFKRQVDDFGIASPSHRCADILFDALDEHLQIPIKR
jgi:hypothetical protein